MKFTSLSVRVWQPWLDILKQAARAVDVSVPEYVRSKLGPIMAKDAGVELPEFPEFYRGRHSKQATAASALGMPVEQWRRQALESLADATIKQLGSGAAPAPQARRTKVGR